MSPAGPPPPGAGPQPAGSRRVPSAESRRGTVERVTAETAVLVVVDLDQPLRPGECSVGEPGDAEPVPDRPGGTEPVPDRPGGTEPVPDRPASAEPVPDRPADAELDRPVSTGIPFFDHMLDQLGRHGELGLLVRVHGDVSVDAHHTVEDTGIALGEALGHALGDRAGIRRFASLSLPLDEALVDVALDCSGRPYLYWDVPAAGGPLGTPGFDPQLAEEFWRAVVVGAGLTLHVELRRGRNPHHVVEATFKAMARALHHATRRNGDAVPSTKGRLG